MTLVIKALKEFDLLEWAVKQRPNSAWSFICCTNITFNLTKLSFPKYYGKPCILPKHLLSNKSVQSLLCNEKSKSYKDNLCFFCAPALKLICKCVNKLFIKV